MKHPLATELVDWVENLSILTPTQMTSINTHVQGCRQCQRAIVYIQHSGTDDWCEECDYPMYEHPGGECPTEAERVAADTFWAEEREYTYGEGWER